MGLALPDGNGFHAFTDDVSVRYEKMCAGDKASDEPGGKTMLDLINSLPRETLGENSFTYTFCDGMIRLEGDKYPVDAIEFKYDICESTEQTVIYGENSIKAIVKNITDGTESHVDRFGCVAERKPVTGTEG